MDFITFKLIPLSNFEEFANISEKYFGDLIECIQSIILINCGGTINVYDYLNIKNHMTVYIFDSHRPTHLSNIYSPLQVLVIDDSELLHVSEKYWPAYEQIELQQINNDAAYDHEDLHIYRRQLIDYYKESYISSPMSSYFYSLARELGKVNNDILWNCMVGVASQYILNVIDEEKYLEGLILLKGEVNRTNEILEELSTPGLTGLQLIQNDSNISHAPIEQHYGRITLEEDFNFYLTKHWDLYSAMLYSPFIGQYYQVWNEKGKGKLETLLAKMGIPLSDARQPYLFMDPLLKKRLKSQLEKYGPEEGLDDPMTQCFVRKLGYKLKLSTFDQIHILKAVLSSSIPLDKKSSDESASEEIKEDKLTMKKNFYVAFDALDRQSNDLLQKGLNLAKLHAQKILKMASQLLLQRTIKTFKSFRFGVLSTSLYATKHGHSNYHSHHAHSVYDTSYHTTHKDSPFIHSIENEAEWWCHSLSLSSLAFYIANFQKNLPISKLPLILAALSHNKKKHFVVGYDPFSLTNNTKPIAFGEAFRKAAEDSRSIITFENFESNCFFIEAPHLQKFMQMLQVTLSPLVNAQKDLQENKSSNSSNSSLMESQENVENGTHGLKRPYTHNNKIEIKRLKQSLSKVNNVPLKDITDEKHEELEEEEELDEDDEMDDFINDESLDSDYEEPDIL